MLLAILKAEKHNTVRSDTLPREPKRYHALNRTHGERRADGRMKMLDKRQTEAEEVAQEASSLRRVLWRGVTAKANEARGEHLPLSTLEQDLCMMCARRYV